LGSRGFASVILSDIIPISVFADGVEGAGPETAEEELPPPPPHPAINVMIANDNTIPTILCTFLIIYPCSYYVLSEKAVNDVDLATWRSH
jgi:hypothetical protein